MSRPRDPDPVDIRAELDPAYPPLRELIFPMTEAETCEALRAFFPSLTDRAFAILCDRGVIEANAFTRDGTRVFDFIDALDMMNRYSAKMTWQDLKAEG